MPRHMPGVPGVIPPRHLTGVPPFRRFANNFEVSREEILSVLRAHEPELRRAGILRVALVGSAVRGDADETSDVDLLTVIDKARGLSLIQLVGLERRLAELIGTDVDLLDSETLPERVRRTAEAEAVIAF
jgi:predicted nucleotidyltransferase